MYTARIFAVLSLLFLSLGLVTALPSPGTSITTTITIQTTNGTVTETCVSASDQNGQQTQNCTTTSMGGSPSPTTQPSATASPMVAAVFVMPGTTLQVLPVGLVVFGGITSIAFFAVAFVTWERVQYRKAFRARRVAEMSLIGYGGVVKGDMID